MRHWGLYQWLPTVLLCGSIISTSRAYCDTMMLNVQASAATSVAFYDEHEQDSQHVCKAIETKAGEHLLLITFEASVADMPLKPNTFGFSLSDAGHIGITWDETQPTAVIQVTVGGRVFLGLRGLDPAFRLQVKVKPNGLGGTFSAAHLRDLAS